MTMRRLSAAFCGALVIATLGVSWSPEVQAAAATLPSYVVLPRGGVIVDDGRQMDEAYGEADFPISGQETIRRGRHISALLQMPNIDTSQDGWHPALWNPLRTSLTGAGWVVRTYEDTNPPLAILEYQRNGVNAWLSLTMFGSDDTRVEFVEIKPYTPTLTLAPPAATPEKIAENASFPYLKSLGGTLTSTDADGPPLMVTFKGDNDATLVGTGTVLKHYSEMPGVSNIQFMLEYRNAFAKAGWEIVEESQGLHQGDAMITAHYAKNGRDIWASLHFGGMISIAVADVGADLVAALNKDCKVAMYGITFEFNQATLRPEAESTLQRVAAALQGAPALNVEIQGHTDNVGGDQYNLMLSQSRADAVKTWLAGHGIAATRLTARGYGRNQPIADNDTDEGRAKNRRVTIAKADCAAR